MPYEDYTGAPQTGAAKLTYDLVAGIVADVSGTTQKNFDFGSATHLKGVTNIRGVATVLEGQTTIAVTFASAFAVAPAAVVITPKADPGDDFWVTAITTTGFTISVGTAVGADTAFMWFAIQ